MRTCIPYNICKWASFYLLANVFFFFPSFVLVPLVLWKLCRDRGTTTGQDGLLAPWDGLILAAVLVFVDPDLRLCSPPVPFRVTLPAGFPETRTTSSLLGGEGPCESCFWDLVAHLHQAELSTTAASRPTGTAEPVSRVASGLSSCFEPNGVAEPSAGVLESFQSCISSWFVYPFP